jgi:hypothetical protein
VRGMKVIKGLSRFRVVAKLLLRRSLGLEGIRGNVE